MPQNTNLNVAPYYDDFNVDKNYHRVLFKPGNSVQARELTTLQSILQNQIERFGQHFFKDGAMVIPGNVGYDLNYTCVEINNTHLGIPVSEYIHQLVGKTLKGEVSNVTAKVENIIEESESERKNNTLYVKYLTSSQSSFSNGTFIDGENLIIQESVDYSLGTLNQGDSVATAISNNSTSVGSAAKISAGVYFTRGFFVNVNDQTLILDQYSNTPSYRVGLFIKESFAVASNEYSDLLDNSQGFYNFAAPGADRLVIEAELIKKPLNDFNDQNFIQLLKIENGVLDSIVTSTEYDKILDELAKRTYDESGDYYVKPFQLEIKESLNNYLGNNGIYSNDKVTKNGNIPSNDLACISVSPGKAYVRGYEVEKISNTIIDYEKPRTTATSLNESIQFNFGTQFELNNVYGYIPIGISSDSYVKLFNRRTDTVGVCTGKLIGVARLYDLKLKSSAYKDASSVFDASLYDIQTYTSLNISNGFSENLNKSAYIEGKNSGANGYLVSGITTTTTQFNLYQVSGSFIKNEPLFVNGVETNRIVTDVLDYSINDIRQISSYETEPAKFTADAVLSRKIDLANNGASFTITGAGAGSISTIRTSNDNFYLNVRPGDIISYAKPGDILPTYNVIKSVGISSSLVTIGPLQSVSNVNTGTLPASDLIVTDLKKVTLEVKNNNTRLYSKLNHNTVSSLDLTSSSIYIRTTVGPISIGNSSEFEVSVFEGSTDSKLVPFDEESYTLTYSDGTVEALSSQKLIPNFDLSNNPAQGRIALRNLSASSTSGSSYLTVTYQKLNCKTRKKSYNRCSTLTINKTKVGINTVGNGLEFSKVYGCRVEDDVISLNVPEVTKILGIFESSSQSDPIIPSLTVSSISGNIGNLIKGEKIIGKTSKAVATLVSTNLSTIVEFCYLNQKTFNLGEIITFEESGISATVGTITVGDKNIINSYILDSGYRDSYLDFSRLIKKVGTEYPTKKIKVVYDHYVIDSNDSGTFVGVNSYDLYRYGDIPEYSGVRFSDILDFRPRVLPYDVASPISPFDFESRVFNSSTSSSGLIVTKDSSIILSYNYYLPRIDKLFLNKDGKFELIKGVPSLTPKLPDNLNYSLEVATLYSPSYVFDVKDIKVLTTTHERYTMKDISNLDDRLSRVEYYTSLSLLETNTQSLNIVDPDTNLNRFKSGFFVDNFSNANLGDTENVLYRASVDIDDKTLRPIPYSTYVDLDLDVSISSNIKKSGSIATLDYNTVQYISNPYATKVTPINPFNILNWNGVIELNPSSDSWIEEDYSNSTKQWGEWDNWINGKININQTNVDDSIKNIDLYVRSRNIGISAQGLKPNTSFYGFFDNVDVTNYIVPKLIEIEMISGSFSVGETVEGIIGNTSIIFRVAKLNHKNGSYNSPSEIYTKDPYTNLALTSNYSVSSTLINVDIDSLSLNTETNFYGSLSPNMILRGDTSGAIAKVKGIRVITDENGSFIGSLFIPDSKVTSNPKFKVGTKTFILTTSLNNSQVDTASESLAESVFISNGTIQSIERNDLNLKNIKIVSDVSNSALLNSEFKNSLAQSFYVKEPSGVFITSCSVYFSEKDGGNIPVTLQIRTIKNGSPSKEIIPFSEVVLPPSKVDVSAAYAPTIFTFPSPVYLEGNIEYCLVLSTSSDDYKIWTSRFGEEDLATSSALKSSASQIPNVGVLFKSQNTSGIAPSPYESLKFTLFRADFKYSSGTLNFYNPTDSNSYNINQINRLDPESIQTFSRSLLVKLNKDLSESDINLLSSGYTLKQTSNSSFSSKVKSIVGKLTLNSNLDIINSGYGYTAGITSYTNVDLISLTGIGKGGKVTIEVGSGIVNSATITDQGSGYSPGDALTIDYKDTNNLGEGVILSIPSNSGVVTSLNSIILDEVQGELNISSGDLTINQTPLVGLYPIETPVVINDGLHLKVHSKNHGMYSKNNYVRISGVESDVPPLKLISNVTTSSSVLLVNDASSFEKFEGTIVGTGNTGYLTINNEIIGYVGVDTTKSPNEIVLNTITSYSRGVDNTTPTSHFINDLVFKYEFNGISLRKINKQHSLSDVNYSAYTIDLDNYYVKISSDNGKYFNKNKSGGSYNSIVNTGLWNSPRATRNIAYSTLRPIINTLTPGESRLTSRIRTYSAKSVDGTEVSFVDNGFEDFSLSSDNNFSSIRGIFSRENEVEYINTINNKSLTLQLNISTSDSKLSPVIDLERVGVIPIMNRINQPITDYLSDSRVNKILDDPNAAIYVSKRINLTKPADSLKVMFDAYRHQSNDIRVAYRIFRNDVEDEYQLYELFPGYGNIDSRGNTIDSSKNTGLPDILVTPSGSQDEFKPYEYNMKTSLAFTGFQIKIIMTGKDQSNVPKIKDLRVIATL